MKSLAVSLIKRHEGCKLFPYKDTVGKLTIGYGRNLDDRGISDDEAEYLLSNDIQQCIDDLERMRFWPDLNEVRRAVITDMRFNLGYSGFRKFKRLISALEQGDYQQAAAEIRNSAWYGQVGKRAVTDARLMQAGEI